MKDSQLNQLISNLFVIAAFFAENPVQLFALIFMAVLWLINYVRSEITEHKQGRK